MGCAMGTIRYIIFFFNFILALAGLGVLVSGLLIAHQDLGSDAISGQLSTPAIVFAVVGGCIFLFAFFGCCGALRESHCMITTYAVLLLTVFVLQVAVIVVAYNYRNQAKDVMTQTLIKEYENYNKDNSTKKWIDGMQKELQCCGSNKTNLPWDTMGIPPPDSCKSSDSSSTLFNRPCIPVMIDIVIDKLTNIGHVGIAIGVVEVVGIIFALCLANSIRRAELRGYA